MKNFKHVKNLGEGRFTVLNIEEQKQLKGGEDFILVEDLTEM